MLAKRGCCVGWSNKPNEKYCIFRGVGQIYIFKVATL